MAGLLEYCQDQALLMKLLPFKPEAQNNKFNISTIERIMLNKDNFTKYKTILETDIPHISGIVMYYWQAYYSLVQHYNKKSDSETIDQIIRLIKSNLVIGFQEDKEDLYMNAIKKMK